MSIFKTLRFIANHPLNRDRKTQSLLRFVRWQIGSRLVGGQSINNWVNGTRLIAHAGETGATGNIYCGLHEFADMAFVMHVVNQDDLFIDVGANTVLACGAKGARGLCFEPIPSTFKRLTDNLRINDLTDRVVAMNVGIAGSETELAFSTDANCMNRVVTVDGTAAGVIKVPVHTLDSILSDSHPSIMKVDVEGFESPVIDGAKETLKNPSLHSVIMELNGSGARYGYDEQSILATMKQHGFAPYTYEPFTRQLQRIDHRDSTAGNLIFIRNLAHVKVRIANAAVTTIGATRI